MELTTGYSFTNILQTAVLYKRVLLQLWLPIFWQKEIGAKEACKMLIKLRPGFTFYML